MRTARLQGPGSSRLVCSFYSNSPRLAADPGIIADAGIDSDSSLVATPRPIYGDAAWPPRGRSLPRYLQRAFP